MLYILNESYEPKEVDQISMWDEWMCSNEEKTNIGKDCFGDLIISTVFIGVGAIKGGEFPQLFESTIIDEGDILEVKRYSNYQDAKQEHSSLVEKFSLN